LLYVDLYEKEHNESIKHNTNSKEIVVLLNLAKSNVETAFKIAEKQVGVNDPFFRTLLLNLAEIYRYLGKYSEAEKLSLGIMKWYEENGQVNHIKYATPLNNLGLVYNSQERFLEADKHYLKAINIFRGKGLVKHPKYAIILNNLGDLYYNWFQKEKDMGKKDRTFKGEIINLLHQAKQNLETALKIRIEILGKKHPHTIETQVLRDIVNKALETAGI